MPGPNQSRPRDARKTGRRAAGRRPNPQANEGYAGNVPPHGGSAPHTVVYGAAPPQEKRGWMKTVLSGALIATGSIIAYKVYNKMRGKDDETPAVPPGAAAVNPAPAATPSPAPVMAAPFAPQPYAAYPMAGLSALGQPPSPTLNAALAMQNMIAQQQMAAARAAEVAAERRRPKLNPPKQVEPELSYMDEYLQQFDD